MDRNIFVYRKGSSGSGV